MKYFLCILFTFLLGSFFTQNNLRVFSGEGDLFTVTAFDSIQNKTPQTNVLLQKIIEDTVHLKIEFENKTKFETVVYLYEKGLPTKNKEFNYLLNCVQNKVKISYEGISDIVRLPNPLVPEKPIVDTSSKYKNTRLGHFCDVKDGKPIYFNNIPKDGMCVTEMANNYLNFINLLMVKAQVVDDKFIIAENVCRNNCLNVAQLIFVLNYIDFELDKLKLVRIAYFHLIDKTNKKDLEKAFHFESSISELNKFFETAVDPKNQISISCKTACTEEELKSLTDKLSVYQNDSQRFNVLKKLYSEYCYSTNQILIILKPFIHDREKLDVAKMLYFNCIEKDNFLSISETFSYNETISEFKRFVDNQKE